MGMRIFPNRPRLNCSSICLIQTILVTTTTLSPLKTALLEAPRKIVAHLKLNLLQSHSDGLRASEIKPILLETIERFTSDWLWDMTPEEQSFHERMLTEGWG